jgi:hypothetical protein
LYSKKFKPIPFEEFVSSKYGTALLLVNFLFFNLANWMLLQSLQWQRSKNKDGKEGKLLSVSDMLASIYGPKI